MYIDPAIVQYFLTKGIDIPMEYIAASCDKNFQKFGECHNIWKQDFWDSCGKDYKQSSSAITIFFSSTKKKI
jgi:hypothetical protein